MRARVSNRRKLTSTGSKFAIANAIRMTATIAMSTWRNEIPDRGGGTGSLRPPPGSLPDSRAGPESSPSRRIATLRDADAGFSHHPRRASTSGPSSGGPGRRRAGRRGLELGGAVGAVSSAGPGRERDLEAFREGNRDRGPGADRLLRGVTELGSIWASVGAAAALAAAGHRRAAARGLAAASVTWLAGQGLKRVFGRPRPY